MIARKNQHFFIINMTSFDKFPEYIVVKRALGMIHVYSRHEIEIGRFVYIRKKNLEKLYYDFRIKKIRNYKKYASFRGTFPDMLDKIIDIKKYDEEKDKAILSIGTQKEKINKDKIKLIEFKKKISSLKFPIKTKEEYANKLGISVRTIHLWRDNGTALKMK